MTVRWGTLGGHFFFFVVFFVSRFQHPKRNIERYMYERDDQGQQTDEERHERKNLDNRHATIPPFAESVGSELQKAPSRHLLHSMSQG